MTISGAVAFECSKAPQFSRFYHRISNKPPSVGCEIAEGVRRFPQLRGKAGLNSPDCLLLSSWHVDRGLAHLWVMQGDRQMDKETDRQAD